jgi:hypothetical protein
VRRSRRCFIVTQQNRTFSAFADGEVDGAGGDNRAGAERPRGSLGRGSPADRSGTGLHLPQFPACMRPPRTPQCAALPRTGRACCWQADGPARVTRITVRQPAFRVTSSSMFGLYHDGILGWLVGIVLQGFRCPYGCQGAHGGIEFEPSRRRLPVRDRARSRALFCMPGVAARRSRTRRGPILVLRR